MNTTPLNLAHQLSQHLAKAGIQPTDSYRVEFMAVDKDGNSKLADIFLEFYSERSSAPYDVRCYISYSYQNFMTALSSTISLASFFLNNSVIYVSAVDRIQ